jgi:hypothetical protein
MNWVVFLFALTFGVEQSDLLVGYDPNLIWYGYTDFQITALILDSLEVGGSTAILIRPSDPPFFSPIEAEFVFFTQWTYKFLSIGYEHACYHNFQGYYTRDLKGYNRFYLRFSNEK